MRLLKKALFRRITEAKKKQSKGMLNLGNILGRKKKKRISVERNICLLFLTFDSVTEEVFL